MNDRRVLYVTLIVATIAIIATLMVAVLAIADADASEKPCFPGSTRVPYGPPDTLGVHVTQPNAPAAYIALFAPDGMFWLYDEPLFGQFTSSTPGQFYVCYTEDLQAVLADYPQLAPQTPAVADTIPCDVDGEPGILHPDGTCWTEDRYNDEFSDEHLATVPSHTDPGRSVADISSNSDASATPPAERPRYFAGVKLPSFARIIALHQAAL